MINPTALDISSTTPVKRALRIAKNASTVLTASAKMLWKTAMIEWSKPPRISVTEWVRFPRAFDTEGIVIPVGKVVVALSAGVREYVPAQWTRPHSLVGELSGSLPERTARDTSYIARS